MSQAHSTVEDIRAQLQKQQETIEQLQKQLQEANQKAHLFETLLEALPDAVYLKDKDSRFVLFNERCLSHFHLNFPEQLSGKTDYDFHSKEEAHQYYREEQALLKTGISILEKKNDFVDANGQRRSVLVSKYPCYDASGKIIGLLGINRDMTALSESQAETFEKFSLLKSVLQAMPDSFYFKDKESRFVLVNDQFCQLCGRKEQELIGKTDYDLSSPAQADEYRADELRIMDTGEPIVNKIEFFGDGGKTLWLATTKVPYVNARGEVAGIIGVTRDITEIKKNERKTAEQLKLLNTLIHALPDPIYLKDTSHRFVLVNQALCEFHGVTAPEDIIGKTDAEFDDCGKSDLFREEESLIMRTGVPALNRKEWFRHKGEKNICILWSKLPYYDAQGRMIGILGINRDITDLEKTREELDQKLDLLQMLIDHIPDYIYIKDILGKIVMANLACVRGAGLKKADELIGHTDFHHFCPEQAEEFRRQEEKVLREGHPQTFMDECTHKLTGQKITVLSTKIPLRDSEGRLIGLVGIGHDMTDLKKQEQMLLRAEKLAAVGTLAAGTAHQFNNFLAIIMGTIELCLADHSLAPSLAENLKTALDASLKANVIVKDLLAFSRQNTKSSQQRSGHINEVVETALRMLDYDLHKDNISVDKNLGAMQPILLDQDKIAHVIVNLLVNARHAVAGKKDKSIRITTGTDDNRAFIRVEDNGCGIPADQINAIFDPFFTTKGVYAQGDSEQTRFSGVGLGLSVCNTIVSEHGGLIDVSSHPGHGSVFTVWLPMIARPGQTDKETSHGRILIVDDEPMIRRLMTLLLSKEGFIVEQAADGEEGLHRILNGKFDAVFTDISMPRLGGVEMLQAASNKLPPTERPAFIVISGYADDHQDELKVLAVHEVLDKPFSNEELLETARRAIRSSRMKKP